MFIEFVTSYYIYFQSAYAMKSLQLLEKEHFPWLL